MLPPAPSAPSSASAATPANDSTTPSHWLPVVRSRVVKALMTSTKMGMVAIRMAASLALVWAMPRFSKVK